MIGNHKILKVYTAAAILGILTGLIGAAFQLTITYVSHALSWVWLSHSFSWAALGIAAMVSACMIYAAWWMVINIAPEAAGSGVPEVEGALLHQRAVHWVRLLPVKFIGGILAISANMVAGREGPTIQMGANLGAMLSQFWRLAPARRDTLMAAGAGAGLAAAFNAPLAGVLFVIEEMRHPFRFSFTNFKTVAICCVAAAIVVQCLLGTAPVIPMTVYSEPILSELWLFFLFGLIAGLIGLSFNHALMHVMALRAQFSFNWQRIYVLLTGLSIGILAYCLPSITGGGYQIIEQSLTLLPSLNIALGLLLLRFMMTLWCYSAGTPGGIFAPLLALGTLLGLAWFQAVRMMYGDIAIAPGVFAVVGMGALFSASIRAPVTGIVLVVEMTGNYFLILPLMISCLTSTTVVQLARNAPIYTQLLRRLK